MASNAYYVVCVCLVCPMFPVSLDSPFVIASSMFSNVYLILMYCVSKFTSVILHTLSTLYTGILHVHGYYHNISSSTIEPYHILNVLIPWTQAYYIQRYHAHSHTTCSGTGTMDSHEQDYYMDSHTTYNGIMDTAILHVVTLAQWTAMNKITTWTVILHTTVSCTQPYYM